MRAINDGPRAATNDKTVGKSFEQSAASTPTAPWRNPYKSSVTLSSTVRMPAAKNDQISHLHIMMHVRASFLKPAAASYVAYSAGDDEFSEIIPEI